MHARNLKAVLGAVIQPQSLNSALRTIDLMVTHIHSVRDSRCVGVFCLFSALCLPTSLSILILLFLTLCVCFVDRVYGPDEGTEELYTQTASDIIKSALEGVNGAFLRLYRWLFSGCSFLSSIPYKWRYFPSIC